MLRPPCLSHVQAGAVEAAIPKSWLLAGYDITARMLALPDFDHAAAGAVLPLRLASALVERLLRRVDYSSVADMMAVNESDAKFELARVRGLVHTVFLRYPGVRGEMLAAMVDVLGRFARSGPMYDPFGVAALLEVVAAILRGLDTPVRPAYHAFVAEALMPLHDTNAMFSETHPLLATYHTQLVFCLVCYLQKAPASAATVLESLLAAWPPAQGACSPKEVLLLHEIETLLERTDDACFVLVRSALVTRLLKCIGSLQARVAQRALQLWENDGFRSKVAAHREAFVKPVVSAILTALPEHWNETVRRFGGSVLRLLAELDGDLVAAAKAEHAACFGLDAAALAERTARLAPPAPTETNLNIAAAVANGTAERMFADAESGFSVQRLEPGLTYFQFVMGDVLAEGPFSVVRYTKKVDRTLLPSKWQEYAVKIVDTRTADACFCALALREADMLAGLAHPHIANLAGAFTNDGRHYIVTELCPNGDLHSLLTRLGSLSLESGVFVAAQIVLALDYLARKGIVYGDLKPENVLLTAASHAKLCDFGSARYQREVDELVSAARVRGGGVDVVMWGITAEYLAPEVLAGLAGPSLASDVWALGVFVEQLFIGYAPEWPYEAAQAAAAAMRAAAGLAASPAQAAGGASVRFDVGAAARELVPPQALAFVDAAVRVVSAERLCIASAPSAHDARPYAAVFGHALFAGVDWSNVTRNAPAQLGSGASAPRSDPRFTRRKHSIILAPMPEKYQFEAASLNLPPIAELAPAGDRKSVV